MELYNIDLTNLVDPVLAAKMAEGMDVSSEVEINRGLTSSTTGLPAKESLEDMVKVLADEYTPFRNLLPRVYATNMTHYFIQQFSFGGGWGVSTTTSASAAGATIALTSTAGLRANDEIYFGTAGILRTISSVDSTTQVTISVSGTVASGETVYRTSTYPDGGSVAQFFSSESGTPDEVTPSYAKASVTLKTLAVKGSITDHTRGDIS